MATETAPARGATDEHVPRWVPRGVALLLGGAVALLIAYRLFLWLRPLLLMLLIAFFVALAVEPAVNALARRGWRRGLATAFVFVVVALAGLGFSFTMGQLLVTQIRDLVLNAPEYADSVVGWLDARTDLPLDPSAVAERFSVDETMIGRFAGGIAGSALTLAGTALGALFNVLSIALFAFYLSADGPRFRAAVCRVLPPRYQRYVVETWTIAIESTGGYLYSRAALAAVSAVYHGIVFTVIGVPNAFALALWVGLVSQFVPTIGTYLAGVLPLVVALAYEPIAALWTLAAILVYQQIENYAVAPRLTARTMSLHPAVAFGSVIAGVAILGPIGALLALPATASIQSFITSYGRRHELVVDPAALASPPRRAAVAADEEPDRG